MQAPQPTENREIIQAAKAVVAEFEYAADRWTEHFCSKTPTLDQHKNIRIYLMAKEIVRLRMALK